MSPEIIDAIRQWLTIFALIGAVSLAWVFIKADKRRSFIKEGSLDIRAFLREVRQTFGIGLFGFIVVFGSMLGVVLGAAILN